LWTIPLGSLVAVVSDIDLNDYLGPDAEKNLADIVWMAPRAILHENVIISVMASVPVLPVRFGSVFSSAEALTASLSPRLDEFTAFFRSLGNRQEWSMRAYVDMDRAKSVVLQKEMAKAQVRLAALSPGLRYFQEQKIKSAVSASIREWIQSLYSSLESLACSSSDDVITLKLRSQADSGDTMEMFFNAAVLLEAGQEESFRHELEDWAESRTGDGLRTELSGPLPPYHYMPGRESD
jgi:hypothetical protein